MDNKLYFAKYVPVEGEIKKGDKCTHPSFNSLGVMEALTDNEGEKLKSSGGTKVKLFLCGKDIQVGDTVMEQSTFDGSFKEFSVVEKPEGFRGEFAGVNPEINLGNPVTLNQHTFKVIGEISPAAKWIQEGDEFYDSEVVKEIEIELYYADASEQFQQYTKQIDVNNNYTPIFNGRTYYETVIDEAIKIKCPTCKTFH